jgi:hypothetical protein
LEARACAKSAAVSSRQARGRSASRPPRRSGGLQASVVTVVSKVDHDTLGVVMNAAATSLGSRDISATQ